MNLAVVFCVLLFSSLCFLAFVVRIFAVLCCSLLFSQPGWTSDTLALSSVPQSFLSLSLSLHSHCLCSPQHTVLMINVLAENWHLLNSPGEILVSLKLVARFPLTSAWPGFHSLALKCSVLLRASSAVSSALLRAVWLHQKLEQKEWCHRATGLGRSFLAVSCCISFAFEGGCDKFVWEPELLWLSDWTSFLSRFIF